jgi:glyoxalase family protein
LDLTFFDWPVERERRGTHSVIRTALRVAGETSLKWWEEWFREHGVKRQPILERDGRLTANSRMRRASASP